MTLAPGAAPALDAVLGAAATLLGMEVVFIGSLTDDVFTFAKVSKVSGADDWPGVEVGASAPRTDSLCHRLLQGADDATCDAAHDRAYGDAPATARLGIVSYVGVPVHDSAGRAVATLCGIDRGAVPVDDDARAVLRRLADVVAAHLHELVPGGDPDGGVVIRRAAGGGWAVETAGGPLDQLGPDLTSAMVLADLLAEDLSLPSRPARPDQPADEVGRLRLSVTQLEHALAARVVVEQAIGVLSERQHTGPREAFERLRRVARARGRRVHDLARDVVASSSNRAVPLPPELAGPR